MAGRQHLVILGGITLVAAIVRFATLDLQSFHHDEAVTAGRIILPNLFDTLSGVEDSERSPPLYYVVAWAWGKLFGTGEVGLRSLSAVIGTLTVPAVYLAGRELVGRVGSARRIGMLAAGFVALNPYLVWYSQEARSYVLLVLFATLALAFFARTLRDRSPQALVLWATASALSLLSHYFALFLIAGQSLWLMWALRDQLRRVVPAVVAVGLVGLALLPLARAQEGDDRRNGFTEIALATRAGEVAMNYVAGEEPDPLAGSSRVDAIQLFAVVAGGVLLLAAGGLVASRGTADERRGAIVAGGVAASVILVPIGLAVVGVDFLNPRNLIAGVVPVLLVAAIGFGGGGGRPARLLAAGTCALFAGLVVAVTLSSEMQREDWRGAAEAMGESDRRRLIVTNKNGDDPLALYLGAEKLKAPGLRAATRIREIQVLSTVFTVDAPPGFRVVDEQVLAPIFQLTRLEASRGVRIRPGDLRNVLRERSAILLDRPG
jgi:mannosyltransferase